MPSERDQVVSHTQQILTEKLSQSGQLGKIRAMVIEASLAALKDEDPEGASGLFSPSPSLRTVAAQDNGLLAFGLVHDFLHQLGLVHTANVLAMESGVAAEKIPTREALTKRFGTTQAKLPVLLNATGGITAPSPTAAAAAASPKAAPAPKPAAAAAPAAVAPAPAPKPAAAAVAPAADAAKGPTKEGVAASVAAVLNKAGPASSAGKDTTYYIANWTGPKEFVRHNQVTAQNVCLEELKNCKVFIFDAVDSLNMDACEDCEVVIAACEGSVFIRECKNVVVTAACKQLRLRDTVHSEMRLFAATDPVVEASHHITFKPFNMQVPNLSSLFKKARLDAAINRFIHVYDFTAEDTKVPQPHFAVQWPNHGLSMESCGGHLGAPECPPEIRLLLEGKLDPAPSSESGSNKSHNIKTGAQAWTGGATTGTPAPAAAPSAAAAKTAPAPAAAAPAPAAAKTAPAPAVAPAVAAATVAAVAAAAKPPIVAAAAPPKKADNALSRDSDSDKESVSSKCSSGADKDDDGSYSSFEDDDDNF